MRSFITIIVVITAAFGIGVALPDANSGVTYIPADQVAAAFSKGAVLVNEGNYMVHASRRDTEGQVEVHTKDADIIYMLEGEYHVRDRGNDRRRQDDRARRNPRNERAGRRDANAHEG